MAQRFFRSRRRYSFSWHVEKAFLDFELFQRVFIDWTQEVKKSLGIKKDQICVDGKTLRGSFNRSKSIQALPMVTAWSTGASMSLGQVPAQEKWDHGHFWAIRSTRFTELFGKYRRNVRRPLLKRWSKKRGGYLLAVKENQKGLDEATKELFRRSFTREKKKLS